MIDLEGTSTSRNATRAVNTARQSATSLERSEKERRTSPRGSTRRYRAFAGGCDFPDVRTAAERVGAGRPHSHRRLQRVQAVELRRSGRNDYLPLMKRAQSGDGPAGR